MISKPTPRPKIRHPLKSKPKGVNPILREQVFARDEYLCQHCRVAGGHLDIHHKRARSQGGADSVVNCVALHRACHRYLHEHPAEARRLGLIVGNKE